MHNAHSQRPEQLIQAYLLQELLPWALRLFVQTEMSICIVGVGVHVRLAAMLVYMSVHDARGMLGCKTLRDPAGQPGGEWRG